MRDADERRDPPMEKQGPLIIQGRNHHASLRRVGVCGRRLAIMQPNHPTAQYGMCQLCIRMFPHGRAGRGTLDVIGAPKKIAFGNVNLVKHKERILYDTHIYFF